MRLIINTDGGARGNPGPAAAAFVVKNDAGVLLEKCGNYLGTRTNNVAEYTAVLNAWDWLITQEGHLDKVMEIVFRLDSELVVRQIKKIYRVKEPSLITLREQVFERQNYFSSKWPGIKISYEHLAREQNSEADALVNVTLDSEVF